MNKLCVIIPVILIGCGQNDYAKFVHIDSDGESVLHLPRNIPRANFTATLTEPGGHYYIVEYQFESVSNLDCYISTFIDFCIGSSNDGVVGRLDDGRTVSYDSDEIGGRTSICDSSQCDQAFIAVSRNGMLEEIGVMVRGRQLVSNLYRRAEGDP